MAKRYGMLIDLDKCIGCRACELACKQENNVKPRVGETCDFEKTGVPFWKRVHTVGPFGEYPNLTMYFYPSLCMHCEDPPCMYVCPNDAIYQRPDGIVLIDKVKCDGARKCIDACPYDVIYFNSEYKIAQKCTMCAHLLDRGWQETRCVTACPADALKFGEMEELKDLIARAEALSPEDENRPVPQVSVCYIGVPRKFIAGEVYCPSEDKCLGEAQITLKDLTMDIRLRVQLTGDGFSTCITH